MMHQFSDRLAAYYGIEEAIVYCYLYEFPEFSVHAYDRDWIPLNWSKLQKALSWWPVNRIKKTVYRLEQEKVIKIRELPKSGEGLYISFVKEFDLV